MIYASLMAMPSLYALIFDIKMLPSYAPEINKLKSWIIVRRVTGDEWS